jgi:hypothetical protein
MDLRPSLIKSLTTVKDDRRDMLSLLGSRVGELDWSCAPCPLIPNPFDEEVVTVPSPR